MECQGAQGGVTPSTATTDKRLLRIDQLAFGQVLNHGAGILDINLTPAQMQGLAVAATVSTAAPIIEVRHGEATLGPVLDAGVECRIAGRGRSTMDEYDQRWPLGAIHGRVKEAMGDTVTAGIAQ
ncbi:hypothetical protein D3C72_1354030 [compost metagenome]